MDEPLPNTIQQNADKEADGEDADDELLEIPVADEDEEDHATASGMEYHNPSSVVALVAEVEQEATKKKRGRESSSYWEHLNNQPISKRRELQSRFQSCNCMVRHHKKSEKGISHLKNSKAFWRAMTADLCSSDLSLWFISRGQGHRNRKVASGK
jgi:hypothetical protein